LYISDIKLLIYQLSNYIEIKCPNIPFTQIWKNLNKNYIPCDWKSTTYLVINDVVTNSFKLQKHRIIQWNIVCDKCLNIDNGVHRIKQCIVEREVWAWIKNKLISNLHLAIDDPEELLTMTLDKKGEAGLWFLAAAMHYYVANFSDGSLNKFQAMVRSKRWSNKRNLERHFGNLLNIF
jgi:hypothetical protein